MTENTQMAETEIDEGQTEWSEEDFGEDPNDLDGYDESGEDLGESVDEDDGEPSESEELSEDVEETLGDQAEKSYKELQKVYGKGQEELKTLRSKMDQIEGAAGRYGGPEKMGEILDFVTTDPEMLAILQQKTGGSNQLGIDTEGLSEEGKNALRLVDQIAEKRIEKALQDYDARVQSKLSPVLEKQRERELDGFMDKLDKKYGEEWMESLETMETLAQSMPEDVLENPTMDDMEDLFFKALRKEGKLEQFVGKQVTQKTRQKKSRSVGRSNSTDLEGASEKPKTMFDAAKIAERKLSRARR